MFIKQVCEFLLDKNEKEVRGLIFEPLEKRRLYLKIFFWK